MLALVPEDEMSIYVITHLENSTNDAQDTEKF